MHTNVTSELPTTSKMKLPLPLPTTKRKKSSPKQVSDSKATSVTASITNDNSVIVLSFTYNDFLKMLDKNNTTFKEDIETSFKQEIVEQLQMYNDKMMEIMNQPFTSFQRVMLQTLKNLVIQMAPQLPNK